MQQTQEYISQEVQRLDIFLSHQTNQTRSQITQLIKNGYVQIAGKKVAKPGFKLQPNQKIFVTFPTPKQEKPQAIDFDVEILYEDDDLLVINKPSGLTVHPAPSVKEPTLVDWLKHKGIRLSTISGEERHGIVHRLDKGTSGAMVVAKTNEAHQFLSNQLQDKSMGRYYIAIITPPLKDDITIIEKNIGRSAKNRLKMAITPNGKYAKTMFKQLALSKDQHNQLITAKLFTGRTHQIRVHLETINRHIIGDHIYALPPKEEKISRILLHAYIIYFIHPKTKKKVFFNAQFDNIMKNYLHNKFDIKDLNEIMDTHRIINSFPFDV
ncbi:Ribosomal large subunit pseudouridine synthase D [hydrothermal vent metagenome]|uniref:Ribosomal large subunit pseudouridine synthase D n=1 Tax=hydrothermal vent metagenome TaxID=652676 RepID=A0A1W1D2L4_9ZZZZ